MNLRKIDAALAEKVFGLRVRAEFWPCVPPQPVYYTSFYEDGRGKEFRVVPCYSSLLVASKMLRAKLAEKYGVTLFHGWGENLCSCMIFESIAMAVAPENIFAELGRLLELRTDTELIAMHMEYHAWTAQASTEELAVALCACKAFSIDVEAL